jgi:hypothetical protein
MSFAGPKSGMAMANTSRTSANSSQANGCFADKSLVAKRTATIAHLQSGERSRLIRRKSGRLVVSVDSQLGNDEGLYRIKRDGEAQCCRQHARRPSAAKSNPSVKPPPRRACAGSSTMRSRCTSTIALSRVPLSREMARDSGGPLSGRKRHRDQREAAEHQVYTDQEAKRPG